MLYELLGYSASVFVAASLLMSNIKWLRYINTIGCMLFVVYGLLISAYPVAIMNAFCCLINMYHLAKIYKKQREISSAD